MCKCCWTVAVALVLAGCLSEDQQAVPGEQTALDTLLLADTALPPADTQAIPPAPPPDSAGEVPRADTSLPAPRPSLPTSAGRVPVKEFLVDVVLGVAEIEVDAKAAYQQQQQVQRPIYAAAEYLRVVLRGARTLATMTNSRGQFFFERVPPGKYELIFLTAKEERRVYTMPVVIGRVPKVQLPDVHIPLDSLRRPAAAY